MRTFAKSRVRYTKSQRLGIFAFIGLFLIFEIYAYWKINAYESPEFENYPLIVQPSKSASFENFNVNELDVEAWVGLGFSEKQAESILKYKYSLGGYFSSKEQLRKCFVISDKKYAELEPYMEFGDLEAYKRSSKTALPPFNKVNYTRFNPNDYQAGDWQKIGFTEKQAETILKYKRSLGGSFTSLDQLKACFVISEWKFEEMKPYMHLPNSKKVKKSEASIQLIEEEGNTQAVEKPKPEILLLDE